MKLTLVVAVFLLLWCLTIQCWNCAVPNLCRIFLLTCHPSIFYVEPLHNTMLSFSFHSIVDTTDVILIYICFVKQNINVVIYCILKFVSYFILYITTQCKLNSAGAMQHPCLTPLSTSISSSRVSPRRVWAFMFWWKDCMISTSWSRTPNFLRATHIACQARSHMPSSSQ